jgi:glycolate oxidase FAD binding subunit
VELLHPSSTAEVVDAVLDANADRRRLLVVGGRRHVDKGNPTEVDAELWTTQLDRLIAYEPAEMIVVVEAGMRVGDLERTLLEGGQEWPVDAPADATVGGVVASGASSVRRLKVGAVRDTVLEAEIVTGDGRLVRSGARTVKNVTGYDLHKLAAGSLGTLGVLVQLALKVRPLPRAARTLRFDGGGFELARSLLDAVPTAAGALVTPDTVELRLEGWDLEVEDQLSAARGVAAWSEEPESFPSSSPWDAASVVAEIALLPSALAETLHGRTRFGALAGVGLAWVGLDDGDELAALRARVATAGGIAPVVRGPGGLGNDSDVPALEVHRRMKASFDPNGVLAPGRGWGGI